MYSIQAIIIQSVDGFQKSIQLPTFFLDENVQGIVDTNHAEEIAKSIICSVPNPSVIGVSIVAVKV